MKQPSATEPKALRIAILLGGIVPVGAGLAGMLMGSHLTRDSTSIDLDSHVRYLSGLLLGIGLGFWSTIPRIETQGRRFALLSAIVVLGGLGRLYGMISHGVPSGPMLFGLAMELGVTPLLWAWQRRLARPA